MKYMLDVWVWCEERMGIEASEVEILDSGLSRKNGGPEQQKAGDQSPEVVLRGNLCVFAK